MANIVPKLNLNRTPSIIINNSMVFAKNIRIDIDNSIHKDYSIESLQNEGVTFHNNLLTRIISDFNFLNTDIAKYYLKLINDISKNPSNENYSVIKVIPDNKSFYILLKIYAEDKSKNIIVKFDEEDDLFHPCNCNWSYSDGDITGSVINNLLGETILIIAEKKDNKNIPLKCINLSKTKYEDNESVYTQTPKIPITNLIYTGDFKFSIPNGVYQFFIRYKIRDNFYTNWFPASKELFAGNRHTTNTIFGTLGYHVDNINSDNSFIFTIQHLIDKNIANFKNFQIGFIVSNKGAIKGRAWKHFSFKTTQINFDYKASEAEEVEITDFTKPIFNVYNVGNVCSFKNKLYISNYKETDFNQKLQDYADNVKINITYKDQTIDTQDKGIVYNDKICILDDDNNIIGLDLNYVGSKQLNELIKPTLNNVLLNAINAKVPYVKKENCTYYIGGGLGSTDIGIYLNINKETCKINKPGIIALQDYDGDDNFYNLNNNTTDDLIRSINDFVYRFIAYYNFGYIDTLNYNFYSAGTDNTSGYFKEPIEHLIQAKSQITQMTISLAENENTYKATDLKKLTLGKEKELDN